MKLDAGLGTEGQHLKGMDKTVRAAEDLGFSGLWTSETKHDAFLPLAIAANASHQIELGTSVAIAFSRSPMETAQTSWDLQDLSAGRFVLGLGTQVKAHITRRFSMPWDRPAARLREYILALRAIWESFQSEGPLNFVGDFYHHTLMTPFFNPGPMDHPEIPIYIAGVNTRLAALAGELCDGFHVHPFHSPEYVRRTVKPAITEGAAQSGPRSGPGRAGYQRLRRRGRERAGSLQAARVRALPALVLRLDPHLLHRPRSARLAGGRRAAWGSGQGEKVARDAGAHQRRDAPRLRRRGCPGRGRAGARGTL